MAVVERGDGGQGVRADLLGVLRELDGVGEVGGADVHDDGDAAGAGLDGDFSQHLALGDGHDGAGAVGAADEQAVHLVGQVVYVIFQLCDVNFAVGVKGGDDCGVNTGKFLYIHFFALL